MTAAAIFTGVTPSPGSPYRRGDAVTAERCPNRAPPARRPSLRLLPRTTTAATHAPGPHQDREKPPPPQQEAKDGPPPPTPRRSNMWGHNHPPPRYPPPSTECAPPQRVKAATNSRTLYLLGNGHCPPLHREEREGHRS